MEVNKAIINKIIQYTTSSIKEDRSYTSHLMAAVLVATYLALGVVPDITFIGHIFALRFFKRF